MEINEAEYKALQKLGTEEVSCKAVVDAIENGETVLQSLHEKLEDKFYYMVEDYWLYKADNDCLYDCLRGHIKDDIKDGLYNPAEYEDDDDYYLNSHYDKRARKPVPSGMGVCQFDEKDESDCNEEDENENSEDVDNKEYDVRAYYEWVKEHDHAFVAERVGLDIDACRDDDADYIITFLS